MKCLTPQVTVQGYPVRTSGAAHIPRRAQGIQALALWKGENPGAPDNWLRQEIGMAFQQMVCLALDGAPAAEMWVITIGHGMVEALDRDRIRDGFRRLYRKLKKWPQPTELIDALPRRPKAAALPEPPQSEAAHAEAQRRLQEIMDMLEKGGTHAE